MSEVSPAYCTCRVSTKKQQQTRCRAPVVECLTTARYDRIILETTLLSVSQHTLHERTQLGFFYGIDSLCEVGAKLARAGPPRVVSRRFRGTLLLLCWSLPTCCRAWAGSARLLVVCGPD